jgi:hypothetical protein
MTLGQLAALAKVTESALYYRLERLRWSVEDAVEKPVTSRREAGRRGKASALRQYLLRG